MITLVLWTLAWDSAARVTSGEWKSKEYLHLDTTDELKSAIKLRRRRSIANSRSSLHNFTSASRRSSLECAAAQKSLLASRVCNWNSYWGRRELLLSAFIPPTIMQGDSRKKRSGGGRFNTRIGNCHHHRTHSPTSSSCRSRLPERERETAGEHTSLHTRASVWDLWPKFQLGIIQRALGIY